MGEIVDDFQHQMVGTSASKSEDFCHPTMGICWHQTLGIEDLKPLVDPSKLVTYAVCRMIFVGHFGH
jgi:hypothetical protein